jgi:hypothetical protein
LNFAIEELGGTLYAETGRDYSLYQISLDPELVAEGIALLGDILRAPAFTQLELEREIILEEINEDLDEKGRDINLDDLARKLAFPATRWAEDHRAAENVGRFDVEDCRRHFRPLLRREQPHRLRLGPVERDACWRRRAGAGKLPASASGRHRAARRSAAARTSPTSRDPGAQTGAGPVPRPARVRPRLRRDCRRSAASSTTACRRACTTRCATSSAWPTT